MIHVGDEITDVIDDAEKLLNLPFGKLLIWKVKQSLGDVGFLTPSYSPFGPPNKALIPTWATGLTQPVMVKYVALLYQNYNS